MNTLTRKEALLILGLSDEASIDDIRAAYKAIAMLVHPDRHPSSSDAVRAAANQKMQQLNDALEVLTRPSDESSRSPSPPPKASRQSPPPRQPPAAERCTHCGATQPTGPVTECVKCRRPRSVRTCVDCRTDNKVWGVGRWRCASCGAEHGDHTTAMTCAKCSQAQDVPVKSTVYSCLRCRSPLFRVTCSGCHTPTNVWGIGNWTCGRCRRLNANRDVVVRYGAR